VTSLNVGINEKPDASKKLGYRLIGDVNYDEALLKASDVVFGNVWVC
jgi:hypothetical protein